MTSMAKLREPVDAFFDGVTVNADDAKLRENRLRLLDRIRVSTEAVADFSQISSKRLIGRQRGTQVRNSCARRPPAKRC